MRAYPRPDMLSPRFLLSALLLASAVRLAAAEPLTIAVIPKGTTHEFWKSIHAGAVKAQRELATHPEKASAYMAHAVLGFNEQLERIAEVFVVVVLGVLLANQPFSTEAVWVAALLFFVMALLLVGDDRANGDHYWAPMFIGTIVGLAEGWLFLAGLDGFLWLPPVFLLLALRPLRRAGARLLRRGDP